MEFPSSRPILPRRNPNPKGARSLSLLPQTKLRQSSSHEDEQYWTPARNRTRRAVAPLEPLVLGPVGRHTACPAGLPAVLGSPQGPGH